MGDLTAWTDPRLGADESLSEDRQLLVVAVLEGQGQPER